MSLDLSTLKYIITHVFCPLQLPDGDDHIARKDHYLAHKIASISHLYRDHISVADMPQWHSISRMLDHLQAMLQFGSLDQSHSASQLGGMNIGDSIAHLVRAQNAAVIFRKQQDVTIFESFELSPKAENVMAAPGKLICSYPGPAIEIPNAVFEDDTFLSELANFLARMNDDILDATPTTRKAQSVVQETRDTTHPRYITELLTGILRSVGRPADITRITKRVGDDVVWNNSKLPWRRSSLWLLIRVAIQTSLEQSTLGRDVYKQFMIFLMCHIANEEYCAALPNHLLQFMSAKISRRSRKLGSSAPDWLSDLVFQTCTSLQSTLEERWREVQAAQCVSPLWAPSRLNLTKDIELSFSGSGPYIRDRLADQVNHPSLTSFNCKHSPRGSLDDYLSHDGAFFKEAYRAEPSVTLFDVEQAVEQGIDAWVDQVRDNDQACVNIDILANKYTASAREKYADNPELLSVMLLTAIELWVALDKIAIKDNRKLADYSPEIPVSLLQQLLLRKAANLHRLHRAHQYISRRHSQSHDGWSVFSTSVTTDSFAVRFYRGSSHLQDLKARIEETAQREVRDKVTELKEANARYAELQRQADMADHEFAVNRRGYEYHANYCNKCYCEKQCRKMKIAIHEWPLPSERLHAEAVVFELDCPVSFNMWRSTTFHLLVDLCSPPLDPKTPYLKLTEYAALRPYLVQHRRSRITLGSDTKPFAVSHYSQVSIPTTKGQVCVTNGLSFYGFDSHACIPTSDELGTFDIKRYCTYQLQSGPYQNLQRYVESTSQTPNEILANQVDCHRDLSIHEFIAFGHLRSGGVLQWLNVLREVRGRSLRFHRQEIHLLLAQAVSEVGPIDNSGLEWHQELQQPAFCCALLGELEGLVRSVEANWLEGVTMDTISFLLRRLLASSPNRNISQGALGLLRTVRGKVFSWVEELSHRLRETPGAEEFRGFLRDAAAICRGTFDVDPSTIRDALNSAEDIKILLSSSILINDHTPSNLSSLAMYSRLLLDRDRYLSFALANVVRDAIQADSSDQGIDLAVRWVWPGYRPGSTWIPSREPNSHWLSCKTACTNDQSSQDVHFNLIDGSLLVNGRPIGRLPNEILKHPLYNMIFGNRVLDVIPADLPGMDYSTRGMISDHQVFFSLRDSDLVIRAKRKFASESDIIELIPRAKLEGDLPAVLIEGHAHWLNVGTSVLEIRPIDSLWEASSENWKVFCTSRGYRMQKGNDFLVDIRSQSWKMVANLLSPLDIPQHLLISVTSVDSDNPVSSLQLSVNLPRYGLSFYIDEDGELQSRNLWGMVYDENQSVGTLFGLVSCLVLRPKSKDLDTSELIPRCILIPDGKISFQKIGHHVSIKVDTPQPALERVTCHTYKVDTVLGCLTGNVSLTNKLYCAYLHALTSGCGVDPLTGRLGTEESLSLLRSAGCWSIMKFGSREAELLSLIASIYPSHTWYPVHLKRMQIVKWLDLPTSSQHHDLYIVAKSIKEHYERAQLFHESQSTHLFKSFPDRDNHLLERSAQRAAYLFPSKFSGQSLVEDRDVPYCARDLVEPGRGEQRACDAATAVHRRNAKAATKNILSMMESWAKDVTRHATLSLRYDRSWLNPDLPLIWLEAYKLLRQKDDAKWFRLLFSLPAMAYASSTLAELVPVFVAFASDPQFCFEDPPRYDTYSLSAGYCPSWKTLHSYVLSCACSFDRSPECEERARAGESDKNLRKRRLKAYGDRCESDANTVASRLLDAWPCETPPPRYMHLLDRDLYNVPQLTSDVDEHFASCYRNLRLKEHITRVQDILNVLSRRFTPITTSQYSFQPSPTFPSRTSWLTTVDQLFARPAPFLQVQGRSSLWISGDGDASNSCFTPLRQLTTMVQENAVNDFQHKYASALCTSAEHFASELDGVAHGATNLPIPSVETFVVHYTLCRDSYTEALADVKKQLGPRSKSEEALQQSGQWPRITAYALFRCLGSNSPITLTDAWKQCLVRLALLALELQRARRMLRLHLGKLGEELRKELLNDGCDGWSADAHPDWLLIQLQGDFLIRRVQANVAAEMIWPRSGNNTAMQLNMGEGKSSVIVPIVIAVLADGAQLVRVIVPKSLTAQMFHVLADRLGGLANRRIYFLPFSRSLALNDQNVTALGKIMSECVKERGILVVQPEHILSLKLVSVEKQLPSTGETQLARRLLELQRWLHSHARDILDESDEILHVRYQLVYTIGLQQHIEGFPDRWTTTEQVLGLVSKHAFALQQLFPRGVEYEKGSSGSFPHFRILDAKAGEQLISRVVQDVIDGLLLNFNFGQLRPCLRDAIRSFVSCDKVPRATVQLVKDYSQHTRMWSGLLQLRGLLATGILLFAFRERRWRVDYGLAPARTMLAVPYRAKDVPAQRAEFGHPDIAIILTCLSYYYGGLTEAQLRLSFEMLLQQDDPTLDYDLWVRGCPAIPECLQTVNGINTKSSEQWSTSLFPLFRRNRATVDFYLSNVVFPKEAKEFPQKLSCSGWDLAEKKERLLTGFSGTNDGQYLLPIHITQRDPDHQRGTNAKVLSYLLQPENNHYMCTTHEKGERRTTIEFLKILVDRRPEIRVLLDVGAQMLDLENCKLAEAWLSISGPNTSAAIFFNEDDELTVLMRDGSTHLLIASPFAQQLDQCVVYLDDAHTRGTDIKFPSGFRAAVTLGPKVTKDRLTQGCMRMRKLGHGHSIMFFAPLEIDRRIRSVTRKKLSDGIEAMDILQWTIRETCDDIQQRAPHWAQQGTDHSSRYAVWTSFCREELTAKELSSKWLQPEAKTLEELYAPRETLNSNLLAAPDIGQRCTELGVLSLRDVKMDEEQEREVVHEAERERQVERPPRVLPAIHSIHPDVAAFVKTGVVPAGSSAFHQALETLDVTSAATSEAHIWSPDILATTDFQRTIKSSMSRVDDYLRPVMWVVSGKRAGRTALVVFSPYEASCLLSDIRSSGKVHLHLYTPRVTQCIKPCDDLDLYSIPFAGWFRTTPAPLIDQLNMFAGQLYLNDYETYIRICRFLCVYTRDLEDQKDMDVGCDGFILPSSRPRFYAFQTTPLDSLRKLMSIRRKGMGFSLTHMGKLLNGRLLSKEDFQDDDRNLNLGDDDHW